MGIEFDSVTTNADHLETTFDPFTAFPCSGFFWGKWANATVMRAWQVADTSSGVRYIRGGITSLGAGTCSVRSSGGASTASTGNTISADGLWHSVIACFTSSTLREVWLDNDDGNKGSHTATEAYPSGLDNLSVGAVVDSSPQYGAGSIAEFCLWDGYILTADDRAALHAGIPPYMIKPSALTVYAPLLTNVKGRIGVKSWDANEGFTSVQDHPKIIMQRPMAMTLGADVAPPTFQAAWANNATVTIVNGGVV